MTRNPVTIEANEPVGEAARRMREADTGAIVVLDDGRVNGRTRLTKTQSGPVPRRTRRCAASAAWRHGRRTAPPLGAGVVA
ncbi:MAG: CBS domain-containing protein [Actinomycetota bacterium]|nr:CBS domain-containing protein [Actinomycetota bacterium]